MTEKRTAPLRARMIEETPTGTDAHFDPPQYLVPGDVIEVEAACIGILRNTVQDEFQEPIT